VEEPLVRLAVAVEKLRGSAEEVVVPVDPVFFAGRDGDRMTRKSGTAA